MYWAFLKVNTGGNICDLECSKNILDRIHKNIYKIDKVNFTEIKKKTFAVWKALVRLWRGKSQTRGNYLQNT